MRTGTRLAAALLTIGTALAPVLVTTAADAAPTGKQHQRSDRPTLTRVEPGSGPTTGGTVVTLRGDDLSRAKTVFFGSAKGVDLRVRSDRKLVVTTPAGAAGTVAVRVVTRRGASRPGPTFTYVAPTTPPPPPPPTSGSGAVRVPAPSGAATNPATDLTAVSCTSSTDDGVGTCSAVGTFTAAAGGRRPLIATRAGDGSWTSVALPLPADAAASAEPRLSDLECLSGFPDTCLAVGDYTTRSGARAALTVRRAGTTATVTSPVVPTTGDATLVGLVCFAPTYCQAAGNVGTTPLGLAWDGTTWSATVLPLPSGATSGSVVDLACLYPGRCSAVGSWTGATGTRPLVEDGFGAGWSAASPALPADATVPAVSGFTAVTCVTAQQCHVVGSYVTQQGQRPLQAVQYGYRGGAFQAAVTVPWPGGAGASDVTLTDVACGGTLDATTTAPACVATGSLRGSNGPVAFLVDVSSPSSGLTGEVPSVGTNRILRSADRIVCVATFVCGGIGNDTVVGGRWSSPTAFLFRLAGTSVEAGVAPTPAGTTSTLRDVTVLPVAQGSPVVDGLAVGSYLDPATGLTQGLAVVARIK